MRGYKGGVREKIGKLRAMLKELKVKIKQV